MTLFSTAFLLLAGAAFADPVGTSNGADSTDSSLTVFVYGQRRIAADTVSVASELRKTGSTNDVNTILSLQKGVQRVPEAGSALLIRGGGPYDNLYLVNNIPMMEPSHFPYHSFADRSGLMIMALDKIALVTGAAGVFSEAANVVSFRPGIARLGPDETVRRPELIVRSGPLDYESAVVVPYGGATDFLQFSGRVSNDNDISWKARSFGSGNYPMSPFVWSDSANLGYSIPRSFGDYSITGTYRHKDMDLRGFGWFAYDVYDSTRFRGERFVPWGMASLTAESSDSTGLTITAGGSRQNSFSGKKIGYVTPLREVTRENALFSVERKVFTSGPLVVTSGIRGEALRWKGTLTSEWTNKTPDSVAIMEMGGDEVKIEAPSSLRYSMQRMDIRANLLVGATRGLRTRVFIDPGLSFVMNGAFSGLQADVGMQTSRPDIRGLPDASYRDEQLRTYSASIEYSRKIGTLMSGSIETYTSWMDRSPRFSINAARPIWDGSRETALFTRGCSFSIDAAVIKNVLTLRVVQDLNKTERYVSDSRLPFEWDIPWSTSSIIKYSYSRRINFYLKGMFAAGLPYQNPIVRQNELVYSDTFERCPVYRRVDLKIEFLDQPKFNRHICQCEVYLDLINILNAFEGLSGPSVWLWQNTREYYWDNSLKKHPLLLEYASISFGVKLGLRW